MTSLNTNTKMKKKSVSKYKIKVKNESALKTFLKDKKNKTWTKMMISEILSVLGFNSMTFLTVTFTDLENLLKIVLLLLSIVYTVQKMLYKKNQK